MALALNESTRTSSEGVSQAQTEYPKHWMPSSCHVPLGIHLDGRMVAADPDIMAEWQQGIDACKKCILCTCRIEVFAAVSRTKKRRFQQCWSRQVRSPTTAPRRDRGACARWFQTSDPIVVGVILPCFSRCKGPAKISSNTHSIPISCAPSCLSHFLAARLDGDIPADHQSCSIPGVARIQNNHGDICSLSLYDMDHCTYACMHAQVLT